VQQRKKSQIVKDKAVEKALEEIGQKLRHLRKKKGYKSSESFAYDNELPRVHYWRIEKGRVNLTIRSLVTILKIHKLTVDDFFCPEPIPKNKKGRAQAG
jgi:transcriptional regulator with XRE-family HTH domain